MTTQEYLQNEIDRQSPKGRLVSKLGMNEFDPARFDDIYRQAQEKHGSVKKCINCDNPYLEKNVRQEVMLCPQCSGARASISIYMKNHKIHTLTPQDFVKIANSKTTRFGRNNPK